MINIGLMRNKPLTPAATKRVIVFRFLCLTLILGPRHPCGQGSSHVAEEVQYKSAEVFAVF
jgi:hypothetical protein